MKISLITLVMISLMPLLAWSMDQVSKETMVQYKQQGWKVEEKKSFVSDFAKAAAAADENVVEAISSFPVTGIVHHSDELLVRVYPE